MPPRNSSKNKQNLLIERTFKLCKILGTKISTTDELSAEIDKGNAMILRNDGNLLSCSTVSTLINTKLLPTVIVLKRVHYLELIKPFRQFAQK